MRELSTIINKLRTESSRLGKEAILKDVMLSDDDVDTTFCRMVKRAFDTYETFGVKQVPTGTNVVGLFHEYGADFMTKLLDQLSSREITGNAARDQINHVASLINRDDWNDFYVNVLLKDLKCGVTVTTWNKVAKTNKPDLVVPVFSCQLAYDGAKLDKLEGKKQIEVKLDGVRVISIVRSDGSVSMHSRNGKPLGNFPEINRALSHYADPGCDLVFDGEVMSSSFQDLMKQVHRKEDVKTDDAILYLFDLLPLEHFTQGYSALPQHERTQKLQDIIGHGPECISGVVSQMVDLDTEEGYKQFKDINDMAIATGFEGIMLKDADAPYESKRTKSWLKIKPFIEVTLEVTDVEEGTGKYKGMLGALVCMGTDAGREIRVNVGSGLTDDDRLRFWSDRDKVVGSLVEVKADAITLNQDGTYSLRFPRFKTFRGFNPGEKI